MRNGLVLYTLEDAELPLIHLTLLIGGGSVHDPARHSGLAEVAARAWRNGGTQDRSPQEINEILEGMAAFLEISPGRESTVLSLSARSKDFPSVLAILADLILNPGFGASQLDLVKKQVIEGIRRSNDNPEEIAYREFRKLLYAGTPFGQVPTIESIEDIQGYDVRSWHRRFIKPNNILMGVSGDFKTSEMKEAIANAFQGWERSIVEFPYVSTPTNPDRRAVYLVEKDLPQSTILLGHLAPPLNHPDHIPFSVLNYILGGGGFNSRLTREIRSNQGLAYSVGSFYRGRVRFGVFGAFCQTKSSSTGKVIHLFEEIIGGLKKDQPLPTELEWAKNAIVNKYIFSFASSASIVRQQMDLEFDSLPADYLRTYPDRVQAVSLEDLKRTAEAYLNPEKALLLVVGKEKDFERPLSDFGPLQRIELKTYN